MSTSSGCASSRATSRKNRVFVFHDFLTSTYGVSFLRGGVVLDVAGGKGDLSWLLVNLHGVDAVVADPRLTTDRHWTRSVEFLRRHPEVVALRSVPHVPTFQPLASVLGSLPADLRVPRHLRLLVNDDLVGALSNYLKTEDFETWSEFFRRALDIGTTSQPLLGSSTTNTTTTRQRRRGPFMPEKPVDLVPVRATSSPSVMGDSDATGSTTIQDAREALAALLNVRLVVGFHPDQAVDSCFDLAALLNVPFCVVPCCVFPRVFPNRRLVRDGDGGTEPVRTHEQLVEYLLQRTTCHVERLSFYEDSSKSTVQTSRNTVLYSLPTPSSPSPLAYK